MTNPDRVTSPGVCRRKLSESLKQEGQRWYDKKMLPGRPSDVAASVEVFSVVCPCSCPRLSHLSCS